MSASTAPKPTPSPMDIQTLEALERKILWLSALIIHNANQLRAKDAGLAEP